MPWRWWFMVTVLGMSEIWRRERALERLAAPCTQLNRVAQCAPGRSARGRSLPSEPGIASGVEANPSACYMTQSYHEEYG